MIKAFFRDGPYDGQVKDLPFDEPPLEYLVHQAATNKAVRYVLGHLAKGIAHYYVPTG